MSAATLDEFTSVKSHSAKPHQSNSNDTAHAERARILETVARKAQEKTLTLQETTDLYARFNQTYESAYVKNTLPQEDESWALKLLEECAQENDADNALQTRVNGEPLKPSPLKLIKPAQTKNSKASEKQPPKRTLEQALFSEEFEQTTGKPKINFREAFIYEQFNFAEDGSGETARRQTNRTFWIILSLSGALTLASLIAISQFI